MRTFGSIWRNRSTTARTPKSGEHEDQIAPRLPVARDGSAAPQRMLRVVESGTLEPPGPGHPTLRQHRRVRGMAADGEELPDRGPERLEGPDPPSPHGLVAVARDPSLTLQPRQV